MALALCRYSKSSRKKYIATVAGSSATFATPLPKPGATESGIDALATADITGTAEYQLLPIPRQKSQHWRIDFHG